MKPEDIHIIVVDDSTTNNLLCKILFEEKGYKITAFENGKEALVAIKSSKPDMVLLDLMMPETDGLTMLRDIKENTTDIPVIIVSAADSRAYIDEALKLKPFDYVKKPIELDDLLEKVEQHLKAMGKL